MVLESEGSRSLDDPTSSRLVDEEHRVTRPQRGLHRAIVLGVQDHGARSRELVLAIERLARERLARSLDGEASTVSFGSGDCSDGAVVLVLADVSGVRGVQECRVGTTDPHDVLFVQTKALSVDLQSLSVTRVEQLAEVQG